jgi:hypothetical protein
MMKYYDIVLGLIPVTFISAFLLYLATGLPWTITVPSAAALSALIIGHALFVNPPTADPHPSPDSQVNYTD